MEKCYLNFYLFDRLIRERCRLETETKRRDGLQIRRMICAGNLTFLPNDDCSVCLGFALLVPHYNYN